MILCFTKFSIVIFLGGALFVLSFIATCRPSHELHAQDMCLTALCQDLSVEIIRQEENVSLNCVPGPVGCGNPFRQLTYKVYIRHRRITSSTDPYFLNYQMLDVKVKLKNNVGSPYSHIDTSATRICFETGAGLNWNNFNDPNGDKVIFERTDRSVAISFANIMGTEDCGSSGNNNTSNRIGLTPGIPPNGDACAGPPYKCAYAELFTVVVNAYPGEAVGFDFDISQLKYVPRGFGIPCNPINFFLTGPRNGLSNIIIGPPATSAGTPNELLQLDFDNLIPNNDGSYTFPVKLKNFGSNNLTVNYLEFVAKVDLYNVDQQLDFELATPRIGTNSTSATKYLHYRIFPGSLSLGPGAEAVVCRIRVKKPMLEELEWGATVTFLDTGGKTRVVSSAACTSLTAHTLSKDLNVPGLKLCATDLSFQVKGVSVSCNEVRVDVVLRGTANGPVQLNALEFNLDFTMAPGTTLTVHDPVYSSGWGNHDCTTVGCAVLTPLKKCSDFSNNQFRYCFSSLVNPVTFQLNPDAVMSIPITINANGCINQVTVSRLKMMFADGTYSTCLFPPANQQVLDFPVCAMMGNNYTINGTIENEIGTAVKNVDVEIWNDVLCSGCTATCTTHDSTDSQGFFGTCMTCIGCDKATITPHKNDFPLDGLTTYDLVLISKHILAIERFNSPYKFIAADANKSNAISTFDIVEFRKLLLGIYNQLPNNTSWRFIDKDYIFPDTVNPFSPLPPENIKCKAINSSPADFVAVKIGDVNNTATGERPFSRPKAPVSWPDLTAPAGQSLSLPVIYSGAGALEAIQLGMRYDPAVLQLICPTTGDVDSWNNLCFNTQQAGELRTVWLPLGNSFERIMPGQVLFYLNFKILGVLPESGLPLQLDPSLLDCAAWKPDGTEYALYAETARQFRDAGTSKTAGLSAQIQPNPSTGAVVLCVEMPLPAKSRVALFDASGVRLLVRDLPPEAGKRQITLPEVEQLPAGVYVWKFFWGDEMIQGHLIRQ